MAEQPDVHPELSRLIGIVKRLRAPDGCPWDRVQTHESIIKNLIEESGEFIDALEDHNEEGIREELGDLLLQVLMHCQIAQEEGRFDVESVAAEEADKLVRRHPHVFSEKHVSNADEALAVWNASKVGEKGEQSKRKSPMDGVPRSMPGLSRIQKAIRKAEKNSLHTIGEVGDLSQRLSHEAATLSADSSVRASQLKVMFQTLTELSHACGLEAEEIAHAAANDFIKDCTCRSIGAAPTQP